MKDDGNILMLHEERKIIVKALVSFSISRILAMDIDEVDNSFFLPTKYGKPVVHGFPLCRNTRYSPRTTKRLGICAFRNLGSLQIICPADTPMQMQLLLNP